MGRIDPFSENTIIKGDCLDIMARMPDECINLVVTDPVYDDIETQEEMARHLCRLLKPSGNVIISAAHIVLDRLLPALSKHLKYRWIIAERMTRGHASVFPLRLFVHWRPILWYSLDGPVEKE